MRSLTKSAYTMQWGAIPGPGPAVHPNPCLEELCTFPEEESRRWGSSGTSKDSWEINARKRGPFRPGLVTVSHKTNLKSSHPEAKSHNW